MTVNWQGINCCTGLSTAAKICLYPVTCQSSIVQENWYFLLSINTLFAWRLGVANLIAVKILFFLLSRYENLGGLCMHFELQVGSPWTNLAELSSDRLPTKPCLLIIILLFITHCYSLFSTGGGNNILSPNIFVCKIKRTPEIRDTVFFKQTCEEMKAILIAFFRLFLVSELNEWKHLALQKPPHFLSALKFYTF